MARAIALSAVELTPVVDVLNRVADDYGHGLAVAALAAQQRPPTDARSALDVAVAVLKEHGYEPHYDGDSVTWQTAHSTRWPRSRLNWRAP